MAPWTNRLAGLESRWGFPSCRSSDQGHYLHPYCTSLRRGHHRVRLRQASMGASVWGLAVGENGRREYHPGNGGSPTAGVVTKPSHYSPSHTSRSAPLTRFRTTEKGVHTLTSERMSSEQRKELLAQHISFQVAQGARVESQSDFQAVLIYGHRVNHGWNTNQRAPRHRYRRYLYLGSSLASNGSDEG